MHAASVPHHSPGRRNICHRIERGGSHRVHLLMRQCFVEGGSCVPTPQSPLEGLAHGPDGEPVEGVIGSGERRSNARSSIFTRSAWRSFNATNSGFLAAVNSSRSTGTSSSPITVFSAKQLRGCAHGNVPALRPRHVWKRRAVLIATRFHFFDQRGVSDDRETRIHQPRCIEPFKGSVSKNGTRLHVQFDMLTEQVLPAHLFRVYTPHPHAYYFRYGVGHRHPPHSTTTRTA